jgi:hypothetical protein
MALSPLPKAWIAIGAYGAYAVTAATLSVFARGFIWPAIILHVIAGSTCYAYASSLQCLCCGVSLGAGALGLGRRCRKCGQPVSGPL